MGKMTFAQTILNNGTEIDFMKTVINYVTGVDNSIECLDDPDDEYDVETVTTSHTPTFRFTINDVHVFTIERAAQLSSASNGIKASAIVNGQKVVTSGALLWGGNYNYNIVGQRDVDISYIVSNGLFLFNFCGISSYGARDRLLVSFVKSGNSKYETYTATVIHPVDYVISKVFDLSNYVFQDIDESISGTFISRFAYKAQPGKVDYIKSCIYESDGNKQFDFTCIYDCTEVSPGSTVSLEDGAYLAVGPHQLVKVS